MYGHTYSFVSSTQQNGCSPLYMASAKGHAEVVDTLLNSGADPSLAWMVWRPVSTNVMYGCVVMRTTSTLSHAEYALCSSGGSRSGGTHTGN